MANMEVFVGTWKLVTSENFDDFLAELGIGVINRRLMTRAKEDIIISRNEDTFTIKTERTFNTSEGSFKLGEEFDIIKTESTFKTSEFSFKLGEKFEENTIDGRKTQTLITLDDNNVLTQVQQWDGKESTITRKVDDGKLRVEYAFNDVKCTRVYKKE